MGTLIAILAVAVVVLVLTLTAPPHPRARSYVSPVRMDPNYTPPPMRFNVPRGPAPGGKREHCSCCPQSSQEEAG